MTSGTAPFKRICIFSDGTWSDPEIETQTNIVKLAKAVKYSCSESIPQLVFYDPGLGTSGSISDAMTGGAFGHGIDRNIQELYSFLALNYAPGDEVYMFGYSRGAYTVRSLAGLIYDAGLVGRGHLDFVKEAYDLYRSPVGPESEEARAFRQEHGERISIKLVACFDTVGALGLPDDLPWPLAWARDRKKYEFHNTEISEIVENGIHALSIDEDRKAFMPTRMTACAKRGAKQVTEMFLPGHHGGIGGQSKAEIGFSENSMRFMVDEMAKRGIKLEFDTEKIPEGNNIFDELAIDRSMRRRAMKMITGVEYRSVCLDTLHHSAVKRWLKVESWRPTALAGMEAEIKQRAQLLI